MNGSLSGQAETREAVLQHLEVFPTITGTQFPPFCRQFEIMEPQNNYEPAGYRYKPLTDSNHIRILRLYSGSDGEKIKCSIEHGNIALGEICLYEALSYMWGPEKMDLFELDGHQHAVRHNLWLALYWLRLPDQSRDLWVDALSINQSDTVERNQQEACMSQVYQRAFQVIIWLGLPDQQVKLAIDAINTEIARIPLSRWSEFRFDLETYLNIKHLLSQEYWSRLWIIQEIYHAAEIVVQCGDLHLTWPPLHHLGVIVELNQSDEDFQSSVEQSSSEQKAISACMKDITECMAFPLCLNGTQLNPKRQYRNMSFVEKQLPLFDLCIQHGQANCMDARDKVYGLHSMAQDCCQEAIPIDYSKSLYAISAKVLAHYIEAHEPKDVTRHRWRENLVAKLENFHLTLRVAAEMLPPPTEAPYMPQRNTPEIVRHEGLIPSHIVVPTLGSCSARITHVWPLQTAFGDTMVDNFACSSDMSYHEVFRMQRIQDRLLELESSGSLLTMVGYLELVVTFMRPLSHCLIPKALKDMEFDEISFDELASGEFSTPGLQRLWAIVRNIASLSPCPDVALGLTTDGLYFVPAESQAGDALLAFGESHVFAICRQNSGDSPNYGVFGRCLFLTNDSTTTTVQACSPDIYVEFDLPTLRLLTRASAR
ncbi:hypothetical protein VTL71DRAFT_2020 [Oculimacula yallundae]|uniref:Heterokaryon incompatibility domain-containing protein n=1 Tax=Oculimacula yallundae TaxID=86028 RepID=A0ABR4CCE0_9HELO